jgi:hypothetical protein
MKKNEMKPQPITQIVLGKPRKFSGRDVRSVLTARDGAAKDVAKGAKGVLQS